MMHGGGKSDPDVVAMKPANKAERSIRRGAGGAKGRDQGECNPSKARSGRSTGQSVDRRWGACATPQ
jgi:hypothetical protein